MRGCEAETLERRGLEMLRRLEALPLASHLRSEHTVYCIIAFSH